MNIEGPAPRPLERCAILLLADGQLEIDRGRTFQQQLGQWDEPGSYVEI
jgi:cytochrome b6-f complex iron-sulfur subunit